MYSPMSRPHLPQKKFTALEPLLPYGVPNPHEILNAYMSLYDEGATLALVRTTTLTVKNWTTQAAQRQKVTCLPDWEVRLPEDEQDYCDCRIVTDGRMIRVREMSSYPIVQTKYFWM